MMRYLALLGDVVTHRHPVIGDKHVAGELGIMSRIPYLRQHKKPTPICWSGLLRALIDECRGQLFINTKVMEFFLRATRYADWTSQSTSERNCSYVDTGCLISKKTMKPRLSCESCHLLF